MKKFTVIFCMLVSGLTCMTGAAAPPPFLKQVLQPSPQTEAPVGPPKPADLAVDWWRYFEVDTLELDQRIIEMSERLQALLMMLPEDTAAKARPLIERIETNMDALANARIKSDPTPPKPREYSQHYTVSELTELMGQLYRAREKLRVERTDVVLMNQTIRIARHRIDSQVAAYMELASDDPDRILKGLNIIAERLALAVAEEQRRLSSAALAINEAKVERLAAEQALAAQRLVAKQADLERLDKEIAEATRSLEQIRERSIEEQSRALEVLGVTAEDKATVRYRRQRVVNAAVLEANAMVRLLKLKAERSFTALLLDMPETNLEDLLRQVADWQETLTDIRSQAARWTEASRQEWNRVNEDHIAAGQASDDTVPLLRVLQRSRLDLAQKTLGALQDLERAIAQTDSLIKLLNSELLHRAGGWRETLAEVLVSLRHLWESVIEWVGASLFKIGGQPVTTLGLLQLVLILFIAWWMSYWLRHALKRLGDRRPDINRGALYTIGRLSHYFLIGLGLIVGLSFVGIDFTNFALVAGAVGIGIGFGLQSIVNNFFSGLILLFERRLKAGDFVELDSGAIGEVRSIEVRSTIINTNDNADIVVPNSEFINKKVINWTLIEAHRQIHIPFKVAYGTDIDAVTQAVFEAADNVTYTLKTKKPDVRLIRFGDNSLDYELAVWIVPAALKRPGAVHAAYMREIYLALHRHAIDISPGMAEPAPP